MTTSFLRPSAIALATCAGLVLAIALVGLGGGVALAADALDEAIEKAQIKERAGRTSEALDLIDAQASSFEGDPRLHFQRFLLLRALKRTADAADALERAQALAATYAPPEDQATAFDELKKRIATEARDVLRFRTAGREAIGAYQKQGEAAAKALLEGGRPILALYVLDELGQVIEEREARASLNALKEEAPEEARQAYAQGTLRRGQPVGTGGDVKRAEKNAEDAIKALAVKRFDEARIAALASLEVRSGHGPTLATLAEALEGLGRVPEALEAAIRALDAPYDAKAAAGPYTRALRLLKAAQPALGAFVEQRTAAAKALLAQAGKARTAKRDADVSWLEALAERVAPTDPAVQKALGDRGPRRSAGEAGGGGSAPAGFTDLLKDPSTWRWYNKGAESGMVGGEVVLTDSGSNMMCQAIPTAKVSERFTLRFEMMLDSGSATSSAFYLVFGSADGPDDVQNAMIIDLHDRRNVGFARMDAAVGWRISEVQALAAGVPDPRTWHRYEVSWTHATKRLVMLLDGKVAFDYALRATDRIDGDLAFGCGNIAKARIRKVWLKNE